MRWILAVATGTGCLAESGESPLDPGSAAPVVLSARIACEGALNAEEWAFEATVTDPDGPANLADVTAFVYDEVSEEPQLSVPLLLQSGDAWEKRMPAAGSGLDCTFPRYSADFVAVDREGNSGTLTAFVDPVNGQ